MAFSADQIIQELSRILEDNGVANPDDIIQQFNSSGLLNDPYGGAQEAVSIKAADFYTQFANTNIPSATDVADFKNANLIFYPEVRNEQIIGFKTWMSMGVQGSQNRDAQIITSKLADFAVNVTPDYTGIIQRGLGGAMVEGVSYDTNTGSATVQLGTSRVNREMIDNIMMNLNDNSSYNNWLAQNPDQIRLGASGRLADAPNIIRYDTMDLPKNYESNRPLQLQSTLKFMDQDTGFLTQEMINNKNTGLKFFNDFQTKDNARIAENVLAKLGQSSATVDTVVEIFGQVYEDNITDGIGSLIELKYLKGNTMKKDEIISRIESGADLFAKNFDKKILTSTVNSYFGMLNSTGSEYDSIELKRRIINDLGLNNYVQEYKTNLLQNSGYASGTIFNSSQIKNKVNALAGQGNFSYSTFDIASSQRKELISGATLNNVLGTNMFMNQDYSLDGIIKDVGSGNFGVFNGPIDPEAIRKIENKFTVVNGKTMFSSPIISNNRLVTNTFKTTFAGMDMYRVAESRFKSRGLDIASDLINQGYSSSETGNILSSMNNIIENQNAESFQILMSQLGGESSQRFSEAFLTRQVLNVSTLVGKDKFKGETSLLGYASFGGLSLLDKQGLRPKQTRETLQEAVITSTIGDTVRKYNVSKVISGIYSSIDNGGLVRNDFFQNENARNLNRMENYSRSFVENKMKSIDVSTRNNVTAMVGNIIGIYDTDMDPASKQFIQERLIGFNESTFTSRGLANSLRGERRNNFNVSFQKIEEMLRDTNIDDIDGVMSKIKSSSGSQLYDLLKQYNLISDASYNRAADMDYLKGIGMLSKAGFFSEGAIDFSDDLNSVKMQGILKDFIGVDPREVQSFFSGKSHGKRLSLLNKTFGARSADGILSGLKFSKSFTLDDVGVGPDGLSFGYYDFSGAAVGSKIHSNTGYKATISGIQDKITVADINGKNVGRAMELGMITSTKASKRGWVGSQITSFLGAAIYQSEAQGLSSDFLQALKSHKLGASSNLLDILGLDISDDLSKVRDKNVTSFSGDPKADVAMIRNIVSNPTLDTMQGARDLKQRFQAAGITDPESVIHIINEIYEQTMSGSSNAYQKLIGRKEINISGYKVQGLVALGLESIAITGSDQTFATGDALKIGRMESRFFDDHGLGMLGRTIRKDISSRTRNYLSQVVSPGEYAIKALRDPKNAMAYRSAFVSSLSDGNTIILDTDRIMSDSDLQAKLSADELTFGDLLAGEYKATRDNIIRNIQKGDFASNIDPNDEKLISQMGDQFRRDYEEYSRLVSTEGADGNRVRELKISLTDAIKRKTFASGLADSFDPKGVIANAIATSSEGLGRVLPNIVIQGKTLDKFNESINRSLSKEAFSSFFDGNKKFEAAYGEYAAMILEGKDLTSNIATRKRNDLINQLNNYKGGTSVIKSYIKQLTSTKDIDVASNLMLLTQAGSKGAAINKRAVYGGLFQDPSGRDFMNPLLRSFEGIKGLDEFSKYSSTFEKIQQRINSAEGMVDIKDLLIDSGFFDRKARDYGDFDKAIVKMLSLSTSGMAKSVGFAFDKVFSGAVTTDKDFDALEIAIKKLNTDEKIMIGTSQQLGVSDILSSASRRISSSLFNMIYGVDTKVQEELTKKGSIFTDNIKYAIKDSISSQFAEGSGLLNMIADELVSQVTNSENINDFRTTKAYGDLSDIFGQDIVDNIFLKGNFDVSSVLKDSGRYDVTKIKEFKNQIASIENMTLVNSGGLQRRSQNIFESWMHSANTHYGGRNKGFLGMLARFPLQSSEHMNTTLNFMVDLGIKDNFVVNFLKKSGFATANSGMVLGKKTALRFGGDFDGDKFYLATLDKALGSNSDAFDEYIKKGTIRLLGSSGLLGDEKVMDAFGIDADTRKALAAEIDYSSKYYSHMNAVMDLKLAKELRGHDEVRHVLYQGGADINKKYMEYGQLVAKLDGAEITGKAKKLEDDLVRAYTSLTGATDEDSARKSFQKAVGYFGKGYYNSVKDATDAMSAANIDKAGEVYYQVNNLRNLEQIFSQGEINRSAMLSMFKAAAKRNGIDNDVFNSMEAIDDMVNYVSQEYGIKDDVSSVMDFIKSQQRKVQGSIFASGNLYNEAIELGIISSKKASEAIYSQLGEISQEIFSKSSSEQIKKYDDFVEFYMKNRTRLDSMTNEKSKLGEEFTARITDLQDDTNIGKAVRSIIDTYSGERGKGLKAQALYAAEVASVVSNLRSVSIFGDIVGRIDQLAGGGKGKKTTLQYVQELMGIENTQFTRAGRGTGVYETSKAGERSIIDKGRGSFIPEDEKSRIVAQSMEEDLVRKAKSLGMDVDELSEKIQETVGTKETKTTKEAAAKAAQAVDSSSDLLENFLAKNKKLKLAGTAAGLLALGSFLGYNKGRSNITTYDEENYNEELGFGNPESSFDYTLPSNLGYYN